MRKIVSLLFLVILLAISIYASWSLSQLGGAGQSGITGPIGILGESERIDWSLLLAAGLMGGLLFWSMESWLPALKPTVSILAPMPASAAPFLRQRLGWLLIFAALVIGGWVVWRLLPNYRQWEGTFLPWLSALALILTGSILVGQFPAYSSTGSTATNESPRSYGLAIELTLFLLIFLLAIFLRVYRISEIPPAFFVDETNASMDALYLMEGRAASPFGTGWYETPNGYIYYLVALFHFLGVDFISLKAASLLPAILTIPAIYLLGRVLFGSTTGLTVMFLLAVNRWHLTMSRWGWNEVTTPLFQLLAAYFLMRGFAQRSARDFAIGGLLSGAMLYTYLSSRLALATFVLFALAWIILAPEGPWQALRADWRGWLLFFFCTGLVISPLAVTYITDPFTFGNRINQISVLGKVNELGYQPVLDNIKLYAQMFHKMGDKNGRHNLPWAPQLDPITGALFVLGIGYALLRPRDRRRILLLLWFLLAMVGGILSEAGDVNSYRILIALPPILLLAADVAVQSGRSLCYLVAGGELRFARDWTIRTRMGAGLATAMVVGLVAVAGYWDVTTYFGAQAASNAVKVSFNQTETHIAQEVTRALDVGLDVYLSPRFYSFSPLRFLTYGILRARIPADQSLLQALDAPPYQLLRPEVDLPLTSNGKDVLLILEPYFASLVDYFRIYYPQIVFEPVDQEGIGTMYLRARLSADQIAGLQGVAFTYRMKEGAQQNGSTSAPGADWQQDLPIHAEWRMLLRTPQSGLYGFAMGSSAMDSAVEMLPDIAGAYSLTVDGVPWTGPRFLGKGRHLVLLAQEGGGLPIVAPASLWWQTPSGSLEIVPSSLFFQISPPQIGLAGAYFDNTSGSGLPIFRHLMPFLLMAWPNGEPFVLGQFSAQFTGMIRIDTPGSYRFHMNADDAARLTIHQVVVLDSISGGAWPASTIDLAVGEFPIQIDYVQNGGGNALEFFWAPPSASGSGASLQPVPPTVLRPDAMLESPIAPALGLPEPARPSAEPATQPVSPLQAVAPLQAASPLRPSAQANLLTTTKFGDVKRFDLGLKNPKGIAAGKDGAIYIAEPDRHRVLVLNRDGNVTYLSGGVSGGVSGGAAMQEPFDLAIDGQGRLYVLDSNARRVDLYDEHGAFLKSITTAEIDIHRARGLFVDKQARIWLSLTAVGRVIALDETGKLLTNIEIAPGQSSQPAHIAIAEDGSIFVTDAGLFRLFHFDATGRKLAEWQLTAFSSMDAAHLALANNGALYMSEPGMSALALLAADGTRQATWLLAESGLVRPTGVTVDPAGALWLIDGFTGLVYKIMPK